MRVILDTIPHGAQDYDTCGNWKWRDGTLYVTVSEVGDWRSEVCVMLHEFVEAIFCHQDEVSEAAVTDFDLRWKPHDGIEEPGDDPASPYAMEHERAEVFERHLAIALHLSWARHEALLAECQRHGRGQRKLERWVNGG